MAYEILDEAPSGRYEVLDEPQKYPPTAMQAGNIINSIPRQLGLTARYGLEGIANAAQLFTEPVAGLMRLGGVKIKPIGQVATDTANAIGLPNPQGANERVIGDATRLLAGSAGMAGGANLLAKLPGMLGQVAQFLSANQVQQLASATGAGLAGGASREAGGNELQQGVSALIGGVAGGKAADVAGSAVNLTKSLLNKGMTTQDLDVKISNVLRQSGVDYSQFSEKVRQGMRKDLASSLQANKELDPKAVARLADFKTAGITPTRGMVSQDPVQITREMNLAKLGANSGDNGLHGLARIQNENNTKLISNLNTLGADNGDLLKAGEHITSSVLGKQAGLRSAEQSAWDVAKSSVGYKQPVSAGVLSDINKALDADGMMPFMNPQISKYMEAFQTGQPFTPQAYRNLQSMLSRETMKGGNEGAAASMAASILRKSDMKPAGFASHSNLPVTDGLAAGMRAADTASAESIDSVNRARAATARAYNYEESSPLVKSVLSEGRTADPQRIAQSYIIGGTAKEAEDIVRQIGFDGIAPIKGAILGHLKDKALSGAADEVGKFSQSAFNKALNAIGERKLSILFSPEEIRALRTNGRVASYMQVQPVGSAVNNSNSGAMLLGRGTDLLKNIPIIGPNVSPAIDNLRVTLGTRNAQKLLPGLLAQQEKQSAVQPLLLPGLAFGGLLSAP